METVTVSQFVEKHKIKMSSVQIDSRPDGLMDASMNHWKCTLRMGTKRMTVYFSQGPAVDHEPAVDDVLGSLSMDVRCLPCSFEYFCSEFGYDTDSRKAEKIYNAIIHIGRRLANFFDDARQFADLQEVEY